MPIAFKRLPNAVLTHVEITKSNIIPLLYKVVHKCYKLSKIDANFIICPRSCSFHSSNNSGNLALTGFGLWTAFGPKAAKLTVFGMTMMINL